jgi:hypothetical protein
MCCVSLILDQLLAFRQPWTSLISLRRPSLKSTDRSVLSPFQTIGVSRPCAIRIRFHAVTRSASHVWTPSLAITPAKKCVTITIAPSLH